MLGMKTYTREYIRRCRSKVDSDVSAYRNLIAAARNQAAGDQERLNAAIEAVEATYFNNMVLILDELFVHRLRTVEGKDGNPLNEVRLICNSLMNDNGIMSADKTIKLDSANSVLKYQVGDEIKLNESDFVALSSAYFAEIESKYL
jgi:hypothetical protein